tara:strand:- start:512 stop:706 length:195 start_codon:yes stop_codon:yes gene_type:complete
MTIDQAYGKSMMFFKCALDIWEAEDKERYCIAENYWSEGMKIYDEYFSDKKMLTQIQDVDTMLP